MAIVRALRVPTAPWIDKSNVMGHALLPEPAHYFGRVQKDLRRDPKTIEEPRKTSQRPVTPAEGMTVAQKIGTKHYLECSAKTREVFQCATRAALLSKVSRKNGCLVL